MRTTKLTFKDIGLKDIQRKRVVAQERHSAFFDSISEIPDKEANIEIDYSSLKGENTRELVMSRYLSLDAVEVTDPTEVRLSYISDVKAKYSKNSLSVEEVRPYRLLDLSKTRTRLTLERISESETELELRGGMESVSEIVTLNPADNTIVKTKSSPNNFNNEIFVVRTALTADTTYIRADTTAITADITSTSGFPAIPSNSSNIYNLVALRTVGLGRTSVLSTKYNDDLRTFLNAYRTKRDYNTQQTDYRRIFSSVYQEPVSKELLKTEVRYGGTLTNAYFYPSSFVKIERNHDVDIPSHSVNKLGVLKRIEKSLQSDFESLNDKLVVNSTNLSEILSSIGLFEKWRVVSFKEE